MATDEDRADAALGVALGLLLDLAQDADGVVARVVLDVLEQRLLGLARPRGRRRAPAPARARRGAARPRRRARAGAGRGARARPRGGRGRRRGGPARPPARRSRAAVRSSSAARRASSASPGVGRDDGAGGGRGGRCGASAPAAGATAGLLASVHEGRDDDGDSDERRADQGFHWVSSPQRPMEGGRWSPVLRSGSEVPGRRRGDGWTGGFGCCVVRRARMDGGRGATGVRCGKCWKSRVRSPCGAGTSLAGIVVPRALRVQSA